VVAHEQGGEAVGFQSAGQGGPGGEVAGLGLDADLHDGHGAHGPTVRVSGSVASASTASGLRGAPPHTVRRRGAHSVVSQRSAIEQDSHAGVGHIALRELRHLPVQVTRDTSRGGPGHL